MAGQGAGSMIQAGGGILQDSVQRQDISRVEINQVRLVGGVRIMASGAGGPIFLDMFLVILPTGGLFTVHHRTAVTFIAQRKAGLTVADAIGQQEVAFQQRRKG